MLGPTYSRLAVRSTLLSAAEAIWSFVVPIIVAVIFSKSFDWSSGTVALAPIAVSVLYGFVRWYSTKFYVADSALQASQGIINRSHKVLPAERISAVDIEQNALHKLLNLYKVNFIDVSGAVKPEITLDGLSRSQVDELMGALKPYRSADQPPGLSSDHAGDEKALDHTFNGQTKRTIHRASIPQLIAAGVSDIRSLAPLLAIVTAAFTGTAGLPDPEAIEKATGLAGSLGFLQLAMLMITLAAAASIILTLVGYGNFQVERTTDRLIISRGLFGRKVSEIKLDRIQGARIVRGPLAAILGRSDLFLEVAGYRRSAQTKSLIAPALGAAATHALLAEIDLRFIQAPSQTSTAMTGPNPKLRRRYFRAPALASATLAGLLSVFFTFIGWPSAAILLVAACLLTGLTIGVLRARYASWSYSQERFESRNFHYLSSITGIVFSPRIQSVRITTNPLQRRSKTCGIRATVATTNTVLVRQISQRQANTVRLKILSLNESH